MDPSRAKWSRHTPESSMQVTTARSRSRQQHHDHGDGLFCYILCFWKSYRLLAKRNFQCIAKSVHSRSLIRQWKNLENAKLVLSNIGGRVNPRGNKRRSVSERTMTRVGWLDLLEPLFRQARLAQLYRLQFSEFLTFKIRTMMMPVLSKSID